MTAAITAAATTSTTMIVERSAALTGRRIACETVRRRISSTSNGAITTDSGRGGWRRSPA